MCCGRRSDLFAGPVTDAGLLSLIQIEAGKQAMGAVAMRCWQAAEHRDTFIAELVSRMLAL